MIYIQSPSYNVKPKSLIFRAFLLISYLKNKARSDEQSWYHVQNS